MINFTFSWVSSQLFRIPKPLWAQNDQHAIGFPTICSLSRECVPNKFHPFLALTKTHSAQVVDLQFSLKRHSTAAVLKFSLKGTHHFQIFIKNLSIATVFKILGERHSAAILEFSVKGIQQLLFSKLSMKCTHHQFSKFSLKRHSTATVLEFSLKNIQQQFSMKCTHQQLFSNLNEMHSTATVLEFSVKITQFSNSYWKAHHF